MPDVYALVFGAGSLLILGILWSAIQIAGVQGMTPARIALAASWLLLLLAAVNYFNNTWASVLSVLLFTGILIAYDRLIARQLNKQTNAILIIQFDDDCVRIRKPDIYYRLRLYNDSANVAAQNVQVLLTNVVPRPRSLMFRADFPYRLNPIDKGSGGLLNPKSPELFQICASWISGSGQIMVDLDTKPNGHHFAFPIEPDETWRLEIEARCANGPMAHAVFLVEHTEKWAKLSKIA